MNENKIKYTVRIIGAVVFFAILVCLLILDIGFAKYHTINMSSDNFKPQASTLFPEARVVVDNSIWQVVDEPVYFTTRMSNNYDFVKLKIKYKNNCCQSVTVGIQSGDGWDYNQTLLDNKDFNKLSWPVYELDNLTIWEKENANVSNAQGVIEGLNGEDSIVSYEFNAGKPFFIEDYQDYRLNNVIDINLAANYSLLTYVKDGLDMIFGFNNIILTDLATIKVYDTENNKIQETIIDSTPYQLSIPNLYEGVYKIVLIQPLDVVTKSITSKHKYINFINEVQFASGSFSIVSNSSMMRWQVFDSIASQVLQYAGDTLNIDIASKKYYMRDLRARTYIDIPVGNINLFLDGLISFDDDYLLPYIPHKISRIQDDADYDFLIAKYSKPAIEDGWSITKTEFDLTNAHVVNSKLRFMIGALGADSEHPLLIDSIAITYEKKSDSCTILSDIYDYIKYWYSQIR
jgi:hypothetical protein